MKPARYHWRHMARDYARLLRDPRWRWCAHCRRPVEHACLPDDDGTPVCPDCGHRGPAPVSLHGRKGPCDGGPNDR